MESVMGGVTRQRHKIHAVQWQGGKNLDCRRNAIRWNFDCHWMAGNAAGSYFGDLNLERSGHGRVAMVIDCPDSDRLRAGRTPHPISARCSADRPTPQSDAATRWLLPSTCTRRMALSIGSEMWIIGGGAMLAGVATGASR